MRALVLLALLLASGGVAAAGIGPVPDGLADALAARAMLGPDIWARVVRIDNGGARGADWRMAYPTTVYALVFELSGILWFYCDANGTQSLSLKLGSVEADKADPGPLFRAIYDRFGKWAWVDGPRDWRNPSAGGPPNACFVECVAALRRRIASGGEADAPRLLSYYVNTPTSRLGHTVLLFGVGGRLAALDPESSEEPVILPGSLGADARSVARYLWGGFVSAARVLPIGAVGRMQAAGRWAALPPPPARTG
ncbi:MAG TPA: hypothetical protein VN775_02770 [Opitutaceae bacterium]|nr:hypothetical protein [Opitutaceae bacterium]